MVVARAVVVMVGKVVVGMEEEGLAMEGLGKGGLGMAAVVVWVVAGKGVVVMVMVEGTGRASPAVIQLW